MKINQFESAYPAGVPSVNKTETSLAFDRIFQDKISRTDAAAETGTISGETEMLNRSGHVLNLLDDYAKALSDPGKTLKEMAPLVEQLGQAAREMAAGAEQALKPDGGLKKLINEVAVTANVAVVKFERGDFI